MRKIFDYELILVSGGAEKEKNTPETTDLGEIVVTASRNGEEYTGTFSYDSAADGVYTSGMLQEDAAAVEAVEVGMTLAEEVAASDLTTIGVQITDRTSVPSGDTVLSTVNLNSSTFAEINVTVNSGGVVTAYIDSDFDGDYDRQLILTSV